MASFPRFIIRPACYCSAAVLLLAGPLHGQIHTSTRSLGLAGAATALPVLQAPHPNPATLASADGFYLSVFAGQGHGLPALRSGSTHFIAPLSFATVALLARSFGDETYRESSFALSFSRSLNPGSSRPFYLGASGIVRTTSIASLGIRKATGISIGYLVEIWPRLFWGFVYLHPLGKGPVRFPQKMHTGFGYHVGRDSWVVLSIVKERDYPASLRAGVEHALNSFIRMQTGFATRPDLFSVGFEVRLGTLTLGFAGQRHEYLGWTPGVSATMRLARKEREG